MHLSLGVRYLRWKLNPILHCCWGRQLLEPSFGTQVIFPSHRQLNLEVIFGFLLMHTPPHMFYFRRQLFSAGFSYYSAHGSN